MHTATHTATTHNEAVRGLLHRFVDEVINGRDLDRALAELVAEDFVEQNPLPGQGPGRAGLGDVLAGMFAGFPDLRSRVMMDSMGLLTQLGAVPAPAAS